ncbi:MAG: hypothetical protein F4227_00330 [Gammaproteobacteria bacterium]|nr:hypothetical protein [Gammaproteobacteria bacterium]MYF01459.1 hypothetical protein [Gammaproteobacteria bacterium]MYI76288.1 hypothetical protein [Gammaproteobacteria bacterium]
MDLDDQTKDKRDSVRRIRVFTPYTIVLLVMFLVLLSLWIALQYYRGQGHQQVHLTVSLEELGITTEVARFRLEMQVLEIRNLIENELDSIENSKQDVKTAHLVDRTEWTAKKDELKRILDHVSLKPTDQLYVDIESAIADIEKILSS